jgi:hypothetical protein
MKKEEAKTFLKKLLENCNLKSNSFVLLEPDPKDTISIGYKVRITVAINNECRQKLKIITKESNLAVIERHSEIIVYRPRTKVGM